LFKSVYLDILQAGIAASINSFRFLQHITGAMKLFALSLLVYHVAAIWPAPQSFTNGSSVVWLAGDFTTSYNGCNVCFFEGISLGFTPSFYDDETKPFFESQLYIRTDRPGSGGFSSQDIVHSAVKRAQKTIFSENFVPWKFHPRNELDKHEPAAWGTTKTYIKELVITQTGTDDASTFKPLAGAVDESYNLTIGTNGSASITAVSSTGVLRGLETFTQLFYSHSKPGAGIYCNLAPVKIGDAPKFRHRGLNLDLSRNWFPKENILRTIDAIAWNKFNRLHIHMTDAQSWPMDIPAIPELSLKGAYQTGLSYTPQDIQDIHTYAIYRGIEVIIEFDMPGHTSSIAFSHPELITAFRAEPWDHYCAEPPCGALKLNSTAVYDFLDTLFGDVLPRVSPYSAYFHTGGDEVNLQDFLLDETVKSNDTAVLIPLLQNFVDHNHDLVRKAGLAPIVWEEMLLEWKLNLGDDVVVQTWISDEALASVTALGHKALFGNYNYWVCLHPRGSLCLANICSTSTVAAANGSTLTMGSPSRNSTPSTTTVPH